MNRYEYRHDVVHECIISILSQYMFKKNVQFVTLITNKTKYLDIMIIFFQLSYSNYYYIEVKFSSIINDAEIY